MKLVRSILVINFYTILSRIVGYFRTVLMAAYLGTGPLADALSIAIKIPSLLRRIFAEGAMNAAFVPIFSRLLVSGGKEDARTYAEQILAMMIVVLLLIVGVVEFLMPLVIKVCVPGFSYTPERFGYLVDFTRITFPFILLISLTSLYSGVLNSLDRFVASSASPMFGNMAIIGFTVFLVPFTSTAGHAMAWGILMSGFVQLAWVVIPAYKAGMRLNLRWPKITPGVKRFFVLLAPAAAGAGVVQINILIDMIMASYLPMGGVSILNYADRLVQLPLSMLGTAVGIALLPVMSRQFRANKMAEALTSQNLALEYSLLLTLPAMLGLILYGEPLVKVLYQAGQFNHSAVVETARTIFMLTLGLPAYILIKIFTSSFFAREDSKTPIAVAVFCVGINIVLNLMLIKSMAHCGLALSTAISGWVNVIILGVLLYRQNLLTFTPRLQRFFLRAVMAVLLAAGMMKGLDPWLLPLFDGTKAQQVGALSLLIIGGIGLFFMLCLLTRAINYKDFKYQLQAVQPL